MGPQHTAAQLRIKFTGLRRPKQGGFSENVLLVNRSFVVTSAGQHETRASLVECLRKRNIERHLAASEDSFVQLLIASMSSTEGRTVTHV